MTIVMTDGKFYEIAFPFFKGDLLTAFYKVEEDWVQGSFKIDNIKLIIEEVWNDQF